MRLDNYPEIQNELVDTIEKLIAEEKEEIEKQEDALEMLRKRKKAEVRVYIRNQWEDCGGESVTITTTGDIKEGIRLAQEEYNRKNNTQGRITEGIEVSVLIHDVLSLKIDKKYYEEYLIT